MISPSACTATLGHWEELLDDHTMDSNHKKMLSMVSSLSKNYQKALDMLLIAEEYYTDLMREAGLTVIGLWEVDIRKAEEF